MEWRWTKFGSLRKKLKTNSTRCIAVIFFDSSIFDYIFNRQENKESHADLQLQNDIFLYYYICRMKIPWLLFNWVALPLEQLTACRFSLQTRVCMYVYICVWKFVVSYRSMPWISVSQRRNLIIHCLLTPNHHRRDRVDSLNISIRQNFH